jgi:hypothetical protein
MFSPNDKPPPPTAEPYSTLEVDYRDASTLENAYAENLDRDNSPMVHNKYAEHMNTGAAQVNGEALPEAVPQNTPPESGGEDGHVEKAIVVAAPQRKSWAYRNRIWILISTFALIILAAVLGGVLGTIGARNSTNKDPGITTGNWNSSVLEGQTITLNATLAAVNWTDSLQIQHSSLFVQNASNSILHLDWNSKSQVWQVLSDLSVFIAGDKALAPKVQTPIAATTLLQSSFASVNDGIAVSKLIHMLKGNEEAKH